MPLTRDGRDVAPMTQGTAHDASKGSAGRTAYVRGCRCDDCRAANTEYRRKQRASERETGRNDAAPGSWADQEGPELADASGIDCPECDRELSWSVGRTSLVCACGYSQPSPEIERRRNNRPEHNGNAPGTALALTQPELDKLERELYGRRREYTAQIETFRDKNIKKLKPNALGQIDWYLAVLAKAETHERVDEIIGQLKTQKWDLQHWYNTKPDTSEIAEGEYYVNHDADNDQCQISMVGEDICEYEAEYKHDGLRACQDHAWKLWHEWMSEQEDNSSDTQDREISKPAILTMARALMPSGPVVIDGTAYRVTSSVGRGNRLITWPGKPGYIGTENRPAYVTTANSPMAIFLTNHIDGITFNQHSNNPWCPIQTYGRGCGGKAEYQIAAPDIADELVWLCEPHTSQAIFTIQNERRIRAVDWSQKISERYYVQRSVSAGMCQLVNKTGPGGNVLPRNQLIVCQRGRGKRSLGGVDICDHHYMALTHEIRATELPRNLEAYR